MISNEQRQAIAVAGLTLRDTAIIAQRIEEALQMSKQIDENDAMGVRLPLRKARRLAAEAETAAMERFQARLAAVTEGRLD